MKIIKQKIPDYTPDNFKINIFKIQNNDGDQKVIEKVSNKKEDKQEEQTNDTKKLYNTKNDKQQNLQFILQKLEDLQKICQQQKKSIIEEINGFQIEKVFGIELQNKNSLFFYHSDSDASGKSEKIVYMINKLVVIYYIRLKQQDYYLNHSNQVTSIALSNKNIVASCDWGNNNSNIRLWDIHSKEDLVLFNNNHRNKIQCIDFFDDDTKIISISYETYMERYSFIYVHSLDTLSVLFSFRQNGLFYQICNMKCQQSAKNQISIISKNKITTLQEIKTKDDFSYQIIQLNLSKIEGQNELNCVEVIQKKEQEFIFITGHQNGKLIQWKEFYNQNTEKNNFKSQNIQNYQTNFVRVIKEYKYPVRAIAKNNIGVMVLLGNCKIQIWNHDLKTRIKKLDFEKRKPFNEDFNSFLTIKGHKNKLMIMTDMGDLFIYKLTYDKQKQQLKHKNQRIQSLFNINTQKPLFQIKQNKELEKLYMYIVQNQKEIWIINLNDNNFCNKLTFENKIICFDCLSTNDETFIFVALQGNVIYFITLKEINNTFSKEFQQEKMQLQKEQKINQCLITQNKKKLVMLVDGFRICWLEQSDGYFFKQNKIKESQFGEAQDKIIQINDIVELDSTFLLADTMKSDLRITNYISQGSFPKFYNKQNLENIDMYLCLGKINQKIQYSSNTACFVNKGNSLLYFPNQQYIQKQTYKKINFHLNDIQDYYYFQKENTLISFENNCIIKYKAIVQKTSQKNDVQNEPQNPKIIHNANNNKIFKNVYSSIAEYDYNQDIERRQEKIRMENKKEFKKSYKIEKHKKINKQNECKDSLEYYNMRLPGVDLKIKRIYGINYRQSKNFVRYCYNFQDKTQNDKYYNEKNSNQSYQIQTSQKESQNNNKDQDQHKFCHRQILYPISNKIILYEPVKRSQQFYDKHKGEVTVLALNQNKRLVASGEKSGFDSCFVHIWTIKDFIKLNEYKIKELSEITQIKFSKDDRFILIMGIKNFCDSVVVVIDWKNKKLIINEVISCLIFFDLVPNMHDQNEFCICGNEMIFIYKICGNYLQIQNSIQLNKQESETEHIQKIEATVVNYYYYFLGKSIEYDLLVGTKSGEIGLITFGKYQKVKEKAHQGQINIMKITNLLNQATTIITAGEDQKIIIWNAKLEFLDQIDLSVNQKFINGSVISLDLFSCIHNNGNLDNEKQIKNCRKSINMLISTKSNQIGEVQISTDYEKMIQKIDDNEVHHSQTNNLVDVQQSQSKINVIVEKFDFQYLPNQIQFNFSLDKFSELDVLYVQDQNGIQWLISCLHNQIIIYDTLSHILLHQILLDCKIIKYKFDSQNKYVILYDANNCIRIYRLIMHHDQIIAKHEQVFNQKVEINDKIFDLIILKDDFYSFFIVFEPNDSSKKFEICILQISMKQIDEQIKLQQTHHKQIVSPQNFEKKIDQFQSDYQFLLQKIHKEKNEKIHFVIKCQKNQDEKTYFLSFNAKDKSFDFNRFGLPIKTQILRKNFKVAIQSIQNIQNICFQKNLNSEEQSKSKNLYITCYKYIKSKKIQVFGTKEGFILISKKQNNISNKELKYQMKMFNSQSDAIEKILVSKDENYLYSISNDSKCIVQYDILQIDQQQDYDYFQYQINNPSHYFSENLNKTQFQELLQQNFGKRNQLSSFKKTANENTQLKFCLKKVIGRKARYTLNCMELSEDKLVYAVGKIICVVNLSEYSNTNRENLKIQQQFLVLNQQQRKKNQSFQISTFCINKQKTQICVGTMETQSNLYFWEVQSLQFFQHISLPNIQKVQAICYSDNSNFLVCICLCQDYFQNIFFISLQQEPKIIGHTIIRYGSSEKIRGVKFEPNKNYTFYTFGKRHLSKWNCNSQIIYNQYISIENIKSFQNFENLKDSQQIVELNDTMQIKQKDLKQQSQQNHITYMCLIFVQDNVFITGTDHGMLYVWRNDEIIIKQQSKKSEQQNAIICLCSKPNYEENRVRFVSGEADGQINTWTCSLQKGAEGVEKNFSHYIQEQKNLKNQNNLSSQQQNQQLENKFAVQSVQSYGDLIVTGYENGDIYMIEEPVQDIQSKLQTELFKKNAAVCVLKFEDQDIPGFVEFSKNNEIIFRISKNGNFCAYLFQNLVKLYNKNFKQKVINMKVFTQKQLILIAFEKYIEFYDISKIQTEKQFTKVKFNYIQNEQQISNIQISLNEKIMAISFKSDKLANSSDHAYIQIMSINILDQTIQPLKVFDNINSDIKTLDFSTDNQKLMFVTEEDKIYYVTLFDFKKNEYTKEFQDVEWIEEGLQYGVEQQQIQKFYNNDKKITKIVKYDENILFVGDSEGLVTVYKKDISNYKIIAVLDLHQSYIINLKLSDNKKYLATSCKTDKSTMIWQIEYQKQLKIVNYSYFFCQDLKFIVIFQLKYFIQYFGYKIKFIYFFLNLIIISVYFYYKVNFLILFLF